MCCLVPSKIYIEASRSSLLAAPVRTVASLKLLTRYSDFQRD
jgi:hypothetical protein